MNITSRTVLSNVIWRFLERTGAKIVQFIVTIILARLLSPDDYGTIALIAVFINILNVFVDSGLGTALIQKKILMILIFQQYSIQMLFSVFCYIF